MGAMEATGFTEGQNMRGTLTSGGPALAVTFLSI